MAYTPVAQRNKGYVPVAERTSGVPFSLETPTLMGTQTTTPQITEQGFNPLNLISEQFPIIKAAGKSIEEKSIAPLADFLKERLKGLTEKIDLTTPEGQEKVSSLVMGFAFPAEGKFEQEIKTLAKSTETKIISPILKKLGLADEVIETASKDIAKITKPEEVKSYLASLTKPVSAIPKAKIYKIIKEEGIREVKGEPVKIVDGVDTFIHEGTGGWVVSESSTGRYLADSRTREGAIAKAKFEIDNVGEEKFKQLLSKYKLPQTAKPAIPKELELTKEARMVLDTAKKRITKPQIPETGVFKMPETAINENQIIKYANKIAELQGDNKISENHIFEALQYNDPVAEIKRFLGMKKQGYFPEYTLETSPSIQRMKEVIGNKEFSDFYTQATKGIGEVKVSAEGLVPKGISESAISKNIPEKLPVLPPQLPQKIPQINEELSSIDKITQVLKESKPLRGKQEALYSAERSQRMAKALSVGEKTTGEAGFYRELGQLKGELPKVQFEEIRSKIGQKDIDNLFKQIKSSQVLNFWDSVSARGGLVKVLEGRVPTENELTLLGRVFPKEFVDTILSKRDLFTKMKDVGYELANIPRSVMASFDLSAPFRQGLFLISHPKRFFGAFVDMFKAFGSENAFKSIQESIIRKPTFDLMRESKLALTEMDSILTQREERFMSSWAEKIPVVGKVIRASGRAYTGFLNKLRADVFEDLIIKADKLGLSPKSNPNLLKEISNFVNIASGRGSLGKLAPAANALNSFFFSPKLMASRLTLLNPVYYIKADPFVRKEAIKSLLTLGGTTATILGLAKMAGADVETDARSSDFGKIKIGNTRIDIMGGFQQYIRMAAQLITGKYVSSTTGKEFTLGEGYKPLTRFDILLRQVEAKEAPVFSFITDLLRGQDYAGKPINITKEIASRFYPMAIGDIVDVLKDDPTLLPISALGMFGFGIQTYQNESAFPGLPQLPSLPNLPKLPKLPSLK